MEKKEYKVLVLDLDGTLTNSKKEITEKTKSALLKAQEKGIILVLASGRPTYGIVPLAEELKLASYGGYILSFNGGTIIDWKTKTILYQTTLDSSLIKPAYEMACEHGVSIISYIDEDIVTENPNDSYIQYEAMLNKMPVRKIDNFINTVSKDVPKCLIVGDETILEGLEKKMQNCFTSQMNVYRSESFFLELVPPAIDKANSLERLLNHLNLTADRMIACGDGYNDLSMIRYAGLGVAMANAKDEVKAVSDFVTYSNEEDGVAHVVEKYLFN